MLTPENEAIRLIEKDGAMQTIVVLLKRIKELEKKWQTLRDKVCGYMADRHDNGAVRMAEEIVNDMDSLLSPQLAEKVCVWTMVNDVNWRFRIGCTGKPTLKSPSESFNVCLECGLPIEVAKESKEK
jgi:hypothetical protein